VEVDERGPLPTSEEAELRCGGVGCEARSLLLAFCLACFSYSSQAFAVFAGVHGAGRGSLKGEAFLDRGDRRAELWDMTEVDMLESGNEESRQWRKQCRQEREER
jgi:hypothetical protein